MSGAWFWKRCGLCPLKKLSIGTCLKQDSNSTDCQYQRLFRFYVDHMLPFAFVKSRLTDKILFACILTDNITMINEHCCRIHGRKNRYACQRITLSVFVNQRGIVPKAFIHNLTSELIFYYTQTPPVRITFGIQAVPEPSLNGEARCYWCGCSPWAALPPRTAYIIRLLLKLSDSLFYRIT